MDNCYWEVGKADVIQAISEVRDTVVEGRGITGALWFSVAKGGGRARDRIGKVSSKFFHTVPFDLVQQYVTWDLAHNVFFCAANILLAHGGKGVPIGGFLSAQEMILWAISKERVLYTQKGFNSIMKRACATLKNSMSLSFKPGRTLTFPSAKVLPSNIEFFEMFGMKGWFQQSNKTL